MARPTIKYKIEFPSILYTVGSCVYKLWYGSKYVFVKAKNCSGSLKMIQDSLNQFMKGSEAQRKPDNLYLHFFNYIAKNKNKAYRVEVLSSPGDSDYNLLVLEDRLVNEARNDKKCLNNIDGAYINQWNEDTQSYNWLSKPAVANFVRTKRKNAPKKRRLSSSVSAASASARAGKTGKKVAVRKKSAKKTTVKQKKAVSKTKAREKITIKAISKSKSKNAGKKKAAPAAAAKKAFKKAPAKKSSSTKKK